MREKYLLCLRFEQFVRRSDAPAPEWLGGANRARVIISSAFIGGTERDVGVSDVDLKWCESQYAMNSHASEDRPRARSDGWMDGLEIST